MKLFNGFLTLLFFSFAISTRADVSPVKNTTASKSAHLETATLAAGCFWGVQNSFRSLPGVVQTRVGYTGGHTANPDYNVVSGGQSGHAETVEIKFDPTKVSYEQLLNHFFKMHDPTTKDRQINDVGTQYRSAIFYNSPEQEKVAKQFMAKVEKSGAWKAPLTTELAPAKTFYPAESEHQDYLIHHPDGYDNHFVRTLNFDAVQAPAK